MKNIKPIIATVLSIAIVMISIGYADRILMEHSPHGVKQCLGIYEQPKNSIDVLFLGSSHVHYGVNTAKLWKDYGIAAYDYSSSEQTIWASYHYLIEACKTQKPKVVVLDFFSTAAYPEGYKFRYSYLADTLNGMKFSLNKLQLMTECFDWHKTIWDKYVPEFFGFHDRYDRLTKEDKKNLEYDYTNFKGFTPYFNFGAATKREMDTQEAKEPEEKVVKYLKKLIDYTRDNDIKLYITLAPYELNAMQTMDSTQEEDKYYLWLEGYLASLQEEGYDNVFFDNTLRHLDDLGMDFENGTDFYDEGHLNYYGSCKYSDYLANILRTHYGEEKIPDHRGDEYYKSWDVHVEEIRQIVEENGYEWR